MIKIIVHLFTQITSDSKNYVVKYKQTTADSELCGEVNAMVVKNVKDANVPLKLLPICRMIWLQEKLTFTRIKYVKLCLLRTQ